MLVTRWVKSKWKPGSGGGGDHLFRREVRVNWGQLFVVLMVMMQIKTGERK